MATRCCFFGSVCLIGIASLFPAASGNADQQAENDFFEAKVRPILVARCYECHSAEKNKAKGGLTLDSRDGWQSGGDTGPAVVQGKPDESLLIRAIEFTVEGYEMPPSGKLPPVEIATLREWVRRGAPDPRRATATVDGTKKIDLEAGRQFWSFRPVTMPVVPQVRDSTWSVRDSDQFVLARLEQQQLAPSPDNDPARILRRLSYDLTGLPPTFDDASTFVRDFQVTTNQTQVIEQATDRLLASPEFGEKWGRHWLDVARYADSNGSSFNPPFLQAWRYRNWVIDSFNQDLPFDRFVMMQIAGDLMEGSVADRDQQFIATGFLMLGSKVLGEFDKEQLTLDVVDEQLDTIGKAMLGLTLGCARCHDHKFDPIPQRDYYALAGIFTSTVTLQDRLGGEKEDESDWSRRGLGTDGDQQLQEFLKQYRYEWVKAGQKTYSANRSIRESEMKLAALPSDAEDRAKILEELEKAKFNRDKYAPRFAELTKLMPQYAEAVQDAPDIGDTQLRIRGVPSARGETVPRGFLQVAEFPGQPQLNTMQSGRLELAQWVASPQNPLTARVFVNRVWQKLFGEGLVRSVDNFGVRGDLPTHPELLDHLTRRFIDSGWRIKPLIREIVTSRAYRMGTSTGSAAKVDPENRLLWRQNKRRLEPEEIRDTLLLLGGQLDRRPAESLIGHLSLNDLNGSDAAELDIRDNRRTIYQPIIRTMEPDILQVFDFANPGTTTGQRATTTVAPQSLFFLNSPLVGDASKQFADLLWSAHEGKLRDADFGVAQFVEAAFSNATSRRPTDAERQVLSCYLMTQFEGPPGPTVHDLAKLCQAILGSTQFQFLD